MKKYKNLFLAEKTSELWPFSLRDINIYFNNKTRRLYSLLCLWKRLERLSLFEKFGSPEKGWLVLCGALLWRRGDLHPRLEVSAVSLDTQPGPFLDVKDRMLNHPSGDFPELSPKLVLQSRHAVRHWRVGLALQMTPEEGVTRIHVRRRGRPKHPPPAVLRNNAIFKDFIKKIHDHVGGVAWLAMLKLNCGMTNWKHRC